MPSQINQDGNDLVDRCRQYGCKARFSDELGHRQARRCSPVAKQDEFARLHPDLDHLATVHACLLPGACGAGVHGAEPLASLLFGAHAAACGHEKHGWLQYVSQRIWGCRVQESLKRTKPSNCGVDVYMQAALHRGGHPFLMFLQAECWTKGNENTGRGNCARL